MPGGALVTGAGRGLGREIAKRLAARGPVGLLDRPRPVLVLPRWRGPVLRAFDALPSLGLRLLPLVLADARRRQRRYAKRLGGA
jgi:NAD(P)-dependent dehydrogenase (short-subunit alcohol dehydrogenase family)